MLRERIYQLKKDTMNFALLVEKMIAQAQAGLIQRDRQLLTQVIEELEQQSNASELKLDQLCTTTLAQYCPKGNELRSVLMDYRMISDLERMGDHAENIARAALYLIERPILATAQAQLQLMAQEAMVMLSDALKAMANDDLELAKTTRNRDDRIDQLRTQIFEEITQEMKSDPTAVKRGLQLIKIASNYERIADLTANICEDIVYMGDGTNLKHRPQL